MDEYRGFNINRSECDYTDIDYTNDFCNNHFVYEGSGYGDGDWVLDGYGDGWGNSYADDEIDLIIFYR